MLRLTRASLKTLCLCSKLSGRWISSLTPLATGVARIRESLKDVHTREEALEGMRRRRDSLSFKADSERKKLDKMSGGIENYKKLGHSLRWHGLLADILAIDTEITKEEVNFGDWKRTKAREWMTILLGGLLECSEKGAVVAKLGQAIIRDVSTETAQPALPQARYSGESQVESLAMETERKLGNVGGVADEAEAERQSNENRTSSIPKHPPSQSDPLVLPAANGNGGLNPGVGIGGFNTSPGSPDIGMGRLFPAMLSPLVSPPNEMLLKKSDDEYTNAVGRHPQLKSAKFPPIPIKVENQEEVDPELLEDVPAWLRSLRLHKYTPNFEGMSWRDMVTLDETQLQAKGVVALGARRKLLRTFEIVRKRMTTEFPAGTTTPTVATPV